MTPSPSVPDALTEPMAVVYRCPGQEGRDEDQKAYQPGCYVRLSKVHGLLLLLDCGCGCSWPTPPLLALGQPRARASP